MDDKQQRIQRLKDSLPIIATGNEHVGLYELNNKSAEKYIRLHLRGNYINMDTGAIITITRKGAEKVTRHDAENMAQSEKWRDLLRPRPDEDREKQSPQKY